MNLSQIEGYPKQFNKNHPVAKFSLSLSSRGAELALFLAGTDRQTNRQIEGPI